ncbi:MAG: HAD family hydrolase [Carboxylicivirga sp.]|jgi:FMN phosphatase YigB (HAD superfamily)|nr:HAD family hydrolase [Carboxylicivirga sp.]MCT4645810.1 HAD family hydrolase [Carboxylicivirga sp.]
MNKYNLIIFDLDDTLFDYQKTEQYAIKKTCNEFSISYDNNSYSLYKKANTYAKNKYQSLSPENISKFREERVKAFFSYLNVESVKINEFISGYLRHSTKGILINNIEETLKQLGGITKVVATNGSNYPRKDKLENSGIKKYFEAYFSAEDLNCEKPNPFFFKKIIDQYNISVRETLIIGDDFSKDIEGASAVGADSCWFNFKRKVVPECLPANVFVIESIQEIIKIVKNYE